MSDNDTEELQNYIERVKQIIEFINDQIDYKGNSNYNELIDLFYFMTKLLERYKYETNVDVHLEDFFTICDSFLNYDEKNLIPFKKATPQIKIITENSPESLIKYIFDNNHQNFPIKQKENSENTIYEFDFSKTDDYSTNLAISQIKRKINLKRKKILDLKNFFECYNIIIEIFTIKTNEFIKNFNNIEFNFNKKGLIIFLLKSIQKFNKKIITIGDYSDFYLDFYDHCYDYNYYYLFKNYNEIKLTEINDYISDYLNYLTTLFIGNVTFNQIMFETKTFNQNYFLLNNEMIKNIEKSWNKFCDKYKIDEKSLSFNKIQGNYYKCITIKNTFKVVSIKNFFKNLDSFFNDVLLKNNIEPVNLIYKIIYSDDYTKDNAKYFNIYQLLLGFDKFVDNLNGKKNEEEYLFYNDPLSLPELLSLEYIEIYNPDKNDFNNFKFELVDNEFKKITKRYKNRDGNFFDKVLKEEYKLLQPYLLKYQIYTKENLKFEDNCFINSCKQANIFSKEEINTLYHYVKSDSVTLKTINNISKDFKVNINVSYYEKDLIKSLKKIKYNNKEYTRTMNIYMYRGKIINHYMIDNEPTEFTSFFIKHFKELLIPQFMNKYSLEDIFCAISFSKTKSTIICNKDKKLRIHRLITIMNKCNMFDDLSILDLNKINYCLIKQIPEIPLDCSKFSRKINLINVEETLEDINEKGNKIDYNDPYIIFADSECYTGNNTETGNHEAYLVYYLGIDKHFGGFVEGKKCTNHFMNILRKSPYNNIIVYFHNLSYDGRMFYNAENIIGITLKGSKIYSMKFLCLNEKGKKPKIIKFKDSLQILPTKIANFKTYFHLKGNYDKEIIPYEYYNEKRWKNEWNPLLNEEGIMDLADKELPKWNDKKYIDFYNNLKRLNMIRINPITNKEEWNCVEYCKYYCKQDVKILRKGFIKQRHTFMNEFHLDIYKSTTIPSYAYKYFCLNSYNNEDIYEYTLTLRDWIRQAVIGGRCMSNSNLNYHIKGEKILDYDACSLYPSAMYRLYLPTGYPYPLEKDQLNYEYLTKHIMLEQQTETDNERFISNYVVEINITNIGIKRQFPLIMLKQKDGNKNINECGKMWIDNIYLEDLVKYQDIKFNIIKGVYWKGKKSKGLSNQIQRLYNLRLERKKKGDPSQEAYKILLNSSYGKTIQKPIFESYKFVHGVNNFMKYWVKNNYKIKMAQKINDNTFMIKKIIDQDDYYVPCIIGVLILSMSKRIMNEVICTGEDEGCRIYYQDTDSIHIIEDDLNKLEQSFELKYGRKIKGNQLGQFHSDFKVLNPNYLTYSKECIITGKKMYLDVLTNDNGDLDYHIRLKGIPENIIRKKAIQLYGDLKGKELIKLYEDIYNHKEFEFDLLEDQHRFKMNPDLTVINIEEFKRKVKTLQKSKEEN